MDDCVNSLRFCPVPQYTYAIECEVNVLDETGPRLRSVTLNLTDVLTQFWVEDTMKDRRGRNTPHNSVINLVLLDQNVHAR